MVVGIVKSTIKNVDRKITEVLNLINYIPKKNKIFIKPNIVSPQKSSSPMITNIKFVEAVIKYFRQKGIKEIVIGEGSAFGIDTKKSFKKAGYYKLAEKYGVKLLDLNNTQRFDIKWKFGKLKIPKILKTHEYINLPKLKTHTQTIITACLKNQKGLLLPNDKKNFHAIGLHEPIFQLFNKIKPDLNIVDAIICLEGNSVSLITPKKKLNVILAGKNAAEVDNVCAKITGFNIDEIKHIPKQKFTTIGVPLIKIITKFKSAKPIRKIFRTEFRLDGCTGCSESVIQTIKSLPKHPVKALKFIYYSLFKKLIFISGPSPPLPPYYDKIIFIGNCAKHLAEKYNKKYIVGCPPISKNILKVL